MPDEGRDEPVRLAELVAALSLGIDLGFGQPMEHVLRQCLIALRLGELLGLDEEDRAAVYYSALLVNVACHSDAYEQAKWFGDDIVMKSSKYDHEPMSVGEISAMVRMIGSGSTPLHRVRTGVEFALFGWHEANKMMSQHAALARELATQLDLPKPVLDAVGSSYEQWNGKGYPGMLKGDEIPIAARIAMVAEFIEVAHRGGGVDVALDIAERRRGKQFDPVVVDALKLDASKVLDHLDDVSSWDAVIDNEPSLAIALTHDECDEALRAIARFVDLKSPYTLGHSEAVAELAAAAGRRLDLPSADVDVLYRSGLVSGFGRLGVSNTIWDRPGPLGAGEWERVRTQPYLTERMLRQSPTLAPLARVAMEHRERLDGSGYPRGLDGSSISPLARVLGAADAYQAMREPRPYRDARTADDAAAQLRAEVKAKRMDGDAVEAVLAAAGHRVARRREGPAGLTAREVEVLRLVARGMSNKEIAARLVISPKTAGNHIEHIYTKIGASNRAAASLFAMQHGLLPDEGFPLTH